MMKQPIEPTRIQSFANFFKGYMGIAAIVAAALPIPATAFDLIPTYQYQKGFLSVYTSLFCFLTLSFVFYSRHRLTYMGYKPLLDRKKPLTLSSTSSGGVSDSIDVFSSVLLNLFIEYLPIILIALSFTFVFRYHVTLENSVNEARQQIYNNLGVLEFREDSINSANFLLNRAASREDSVQANITDIDTIALASKAEQQFFIKASTANESSLELSDIEIAGVLLDTNFLLSNLTSSQIPRAGMITICYLLMFVSAEAAFILMALREYMQDILELGEKEIITGRKE